MWIKNYKKYLSIEITDNYALRCEPRKKKLLFWIQDPRPASDWDEIRTVKLLQEGSYWREELYQFINKKFKEGSVTFISQGEFLKGKAKELYKLPKNLEIGTLLNPIDVDSNFDVNSYEKKNIVIFLGRLENVKRAWIFFEIAKKMPELEFYVLGATKRDAEKNEKIISTYSNVRNLHFLGHVEGEMKKKFLRDAKILVNTSIHEAVPISFLEALSYGTLIVSNQNPDGLTDRFGVYVGKVLGDGFDSVDKFKKGINKILSNEVRRKEISVEAVDYIRENHSVSKIIPELIRLINKN